MVVDPIQSVKGKVVLDAFRLINPQLLMMGQEPRQTTSNVGHLNKPSIQALIHGLNRHYYSINAAYRKNDLELRMLSNLRKKNWMHGLVIEDFEKHSKNNEAQLEKMLFLSKTLNERLSEEKKVNPDKKEVASVGKVDPRKRLERDIDSSLKSNIVQMLGSMVDTMVF